MDLRFFCFSSQFLLYILKLDLSCHTHLKLLWFFKFLIFLGSMIIVFILNTAFPSSLPTWFFIYNNLIAFAWFSLGIFPYSFMFS